MRIDIPKNLWIDEAESSFIHEGFWKGVLALHLHFTGTALDSTDIMAEILDPLVQAPLPKRKIVRFTGLYDPKDTSIQLLIEAFHSWGYIVQAVLTPEQLIAPWKSSLDWLILRTTKPFVSITPHELWYAPPESDTLPPEPRIPNPDRTILYFARAHSMAITTRFITEAKNNWALL